jgi:hypothetical protein
MYKTTTCFGTWAPSSESYLEQGKQYKSHTLIWVLCRPYGDDENIKILKHVKLMSVTLHCRNINPLKTKRICFI